MQHYTRSLIFTKQNFNFQKEKANTMTLLIILIRIVRSLQIYNYDPQSAGINVQSPQSATTLELRHLRLNLISK